jgi:hypothetical protein
MVNLTMMGVGMGLSVPSFVIAVQTAVGRNMLGIATSALQFSRSIGGAVGMGVMGATLSHGLAARLTALGISSDSAWVSGLLDPLARRSGGPVLEAQTRLALGGSIRAVFVLALIAAAAGLVVTSLAPAGRVAQLARQSGGLGDPIAGRTGADSGPA